MTEDSAPGARDHAFLEDDPELRALEERLRQERPIPSPAFRGELGRRLGGPGAPGGRIRVLIAAYAGSGLLLLAVAAIGLAGGGPLAAG